MRTVVVGASSGLGRSIATGLGQRGATVALGQGGGGRRPGRDRRLVHATGAGPLGRLVDISGETWRHTFNINVAPGCLYRLSSMLAMAVAPGKDPVMPELM